MSNGPNEGRVFVITGSTQGLGEATARILAEQGAAGVVLCGRNEDRGGAVAYSLEEAGCPALFVKADLVVEDDCRRVIRSADERFGRIDGLANVAASTARGSLDDTSAEDWDAMMALNVRAPFLLMQEAVRVMRREGRGGSIVNVSSVSAYGGQSFLTAYCTSKGALDTLTKNAAYALLPERIRVNGINVGWMATPNEHRVQLSEGKPADWLEHADAAQPLGRILRPGEVGKLIAYLLSDDAEMMTGSLVHFDQTVLGARD
jgi:NAD(P)-dependent dehydrogenase (short-subunit alcohol dehydrogenase family)